MSEPTDEEIDFCVRVYRQLFAIDNRRTPSAERKKQLTNIEHCAGKMIKSLAGANERTVDAILSCMSYSLVRSRADLQELVNLASALEAAAHEACVEIYPVKASRRSAPSAVAMHLRNLFSTYSMKFSATADEHGGVSQAVATFLEIAHRAGDERMTPAAARKWVEGASKSHRWNERERQRLGKWSVEMS